MAASRAPQRATRHEPSGSSAQRRRLLERLHREHWHGLVAYLTAQTADPDLAQDLAQDTLVRAAANLDHLDPDKPAWPWLRTIASNLVIDHRRRRRERPVDNLDTRHELDVDPFDRLLDRPTLAQALHALPDRQRVAITLRYVDQWKAAEAAELFGITRPAFEQLLHRARTNLRNRYARLTRTHLAAILLPLYRLKETVAARLRARLTAWEQTLHAMGPAAFDAIGQAAATVAVLGLVSGIVSGPASSDTPEQINDVPASALLPELGYHAGSGASAEAPGRVAALVLRPDAGQSGAVTTTRHVNLDAPTTSQTGGVTDASGHLDTGDSQDKLHIDGKVHARIGPLLPWAEVPLTIDCSATETRRATCDLFREGIDALGD